VLAVLPGSGDLAGQWVLLGAHYDHIGFDQVTEDSIAIFNGADDNASGTALMLEIARYLSHYLTAVAGGNTDHRSIMFQAYGAEEVGLRGSSHFVANPSVPLDSVVGMINLDMVGRLRDDRLIMGGARTSDLWDLLLVELNDDRLDLEYSDAGLTRSDQYPFYELGIPVLFFHTGLHSQYHEPSDDTWLINLDGMVEVGNLALGVLFNTAIGEEPPEFVR
jgi:Zn-dependent M28 family amino/carboxypeptidase